ncbi:MAG TPA: ABC transporter ATP-binding protein [Polyangiaceae bacterium]
MTLLTAADVRISFSTPRGTLRAVDGVDLELGDSETVALVGESGCGKSTLAKGIVGLEPLAGGRISFQGEPLDHQRERFRISRQLQMVFQDPDASLNPRLTLNQALAEPLRIHGIVPRAAEEAAVCDLLERVGIDPVLRNRYPHELSGGQKQRVCIARALAVKPKLLILDEAVSALDVSVRAQILNLLSDLKRDLGLAYLFITHDLGVVRQFADRVYVMYLGQMVEVARAEELFSTPEHPYTQALLASVPRLEVGSFRREPVLLGDVPSPLSPPAGCRFHTRCPKVFDRCQEAPPVVSLANRRVRCWLHVDAARADDADAAASGD